MEGKVVFIFDIEGGGVVGWYTPINQPVTQYLCYNYNIKQKQHTLKKYLKTHPNTPTSAKSPEIVTPPQFIPSLNTSHYLPSYTSNSLS